jgi:hypothetical protein
MAGTVVDIRETQIVGTPENKEVEKKMRTRQIL